MPNIAPPPTTQAHEEIAGRIQVLRNQAKEARRMVGYYSDMAQEQRKAADALDALLASYQGLIEDADIEV